MRNFKRVLLFAPGQTPKTKAKRHCFLFYLKRYRFTLAKALLFVFPSSFFVFVFFSSFSSSSLCFTREICHSFSSSPPLRFHLPFFVFSSSFFHPNLEVSGIRTGTVTVNVAAITRIPRWTHEPSQLSQPQVMLRSLAFLGYGKMGTILIAINFCFI